MVSEVKRTPRKAKTTTRSDPRTTTEPKQGNLGSTTTTTNMPKAKAKTNKRTRSEDEEGNPGTSRTRETLGVPSSKRRCLAYNGSPPKLDIHGDLATFKVWQRQWSVFLISSGIEDKDEDIKDKAMEAALYQAMTPETVQWIESRRDADEDADGDWNPEDIVRLVEQYFAKESSTLMKILDLMSITKDEGDTEDMFATRLRRQTNEAGVRQINDWPDFLMLLLFLQNIKEDETRKQILMREPEMFQEAVKMAKA